LTDVAEVVVRATPEGIDETQDKLEGLESSTEETTDELDETAAGLGGLSKKFGGAMGAIVGGLAVAVGGLLSQVPVLGELSDGIGAVINSIAFKIDKRLRPAVSSVTDELFDLASDIDESDSIADVFLDTLQSLQGIRDIVITASVDFVIEGDLEDAINLPNISKLIALYIQEQTPAIDMPVDGLATAIRYWLEFAVVKPIQNFSFADAFQSIRNRLSNGFDSAISRARKWGRDLISRFVDGINSKLPSLRGILSNISLGGGVTVGDLATGVDATSTIGGGGNGNSSFIGSVANGASKIFLDGTSIEDNQGRIRKDALTRNGG
jgi:hypothetical protein